MGILNSILINFAVLFMACGKSPVSDKPSTGNNLQIVIDPHIVKQTIHSFGASDCWSAKFVGEWTDNNKKNRIADLLFSLDTADNGTPKGVGLSLWRFNIGGGSF